MSVLLELCFEFFKVGLFTVGGGLASLPFLTQMTFTHPQWFDAQMLGNMVAVSQSTPGPIGINMATYVGYIVSGVPGAILASLSMILPSILIVIPLSGILEKVKDNQIVKSVFSALRAAVTGLIMAAGFTLVKMAIGLDGAKPTGLQDALGMVHWPSLIIMAALVALLQIKKLKKLHPIVFIAAGALVGILLKLS